MKKQQKTILITILISSLTFLIGWFFSSDLFLWLLPIKPGLSYVSDLTSLFNITVGFSIVFALIPILIALTWYFGNIKIFKNRLFVLATILLTISIGIIIRREMIKSKVVSQKSTYQSPVEVIGAIFQNETHINKVKFEYYILGGLITGSILSYFLFRQKQTKHPTNTFEFEELNV